MNAVVLAARLLYRDWRARQLRVLAAALVIAVASMTTVGFFTDRIRVALQHQASELLAADLVVVSPDEIAPAWETRARAAGLRTARTVAFPSVVLAGDAPQLVEVKAVGEGYPLRGTLRVAELPFGTETPVSAIPARGTVWLDARLTAALGLSMGGRVRLGSAELAVGRVLAYEPDRGGNLFSIAPRLMMNISDLSATGLIQPGSRVRHHLLLAGDDRALADYRAWVEPRLAGAARLEGVRDARPELRTALERAEKFLGLAALISVILAGVAVATATRRHVARHFDSSAVLRCFGATQRQIVWIFGLQMAILGLLASLVGCTLGYLAQQGLAYLLAGLIAGVLPAPSLYPLLYGLVIGFVTLLGFAVPPLLRLKDVPPLRVLRRELGPLPARGITVYGAAVATVAALMVWQARDTALAGYVLAGIGVTLLALALGAYLLVQTLGALRARVGVAWRYGLANVARRAHASVAQVVAFGVGIMVLLVLSLVRADLLAAWQQRLPADAPNQFVINVQPDQVPAIRDFFARSLAADVAPRLYPMVRGRLIAVNGRNVSPQDYTDDRAQRLVEREFNLSWAARPQEDNRIVAGHWWAEADVGRDIVSVEQGLAETLGLRLGDRLAFLIAGQEWEVEVTSLRSVEWDSFRPNFFVVAPPGVLDDYPATYITAFYLDATQRDVLGRLVRHFPNVTIIDVDAIMARVRSIMDRVNLSVQYVFLFTLLAGLTVLYAAIQATQDERFYESALLRTLGASRAQLIKGLAAEFFALGLLAGVLAAAAASLTGFVLAREVFHLAYGFNLWLWVAGVTGGALGVGLFGIWGTRHVLRRPPLVSLRAL